MGHFKKDGLKPKKNENYKAYEDNDSINFADDIDALIITMDNVINFWILGLGAPFHSSPSQELF